MKLIRTTGRGRARPRQRRWPRWNSAAARRSMRLLPAVKRIVADVRRRGDRALLRYAVKFDGLAGPKALRVTQEEMAAAWERTRSGAARCADDGGEADSRALPKRQMPGSWSASPVAGLTTGQLVRPLGSVGCYVPSGRHPLPSTLLMTAIPAQVAGVRANRGRSRRSLRRRRLPRRICSASRSSIAWAARMPLPRWLTERRASPRVDKIVGPGNLYVTAAKRLVAFDCAIDMLAGPTEIVVTSERGDRGRHCERSCGAGRARSRGAGDLRHDARRPGAGGDRRSKGAQPRQSRCARSA